MLPLADELETLVPYLRRYARALTGEQEIADTLAIRALELIQEDRSQISDTHPIRLSLHRTFHQVWSRFGSNSAKSPTTDGPFLYTREALLLATLEGLDRAEIGFILGMPMEDVGPLLRHAATEMQGGTTGKVLIIEDDAIIAADLTKILMQRGHHVLATARTLNEAVKVAREDPPELILADIQLADGTSGIDAVQEILAEFGQMPIIFITAFPDRLLTGRRPEPAFLITKPYNNEQVGSAVSQAMFFASTDVFTP